MVFVQSSGKWKIASAAMDFGYAWQVVVPDIKRTHFRLTNEFAVGRDASLQSMTFLVFHPPCHSRLSLAFDEFQTTEMPFRHTSGTGSRVRYHSTRRTRESGHFFVGLFHHHNDRAEHNRNYNNSVHNPSLSLRLHFLWVVVNRDTHGIDHSCLSESKHNTG
jgi:hypothetical protein